MNKKIKIALVAMVAVVFGLAITAMVSAITMKSTPIENVSAPMHNKISTSATVSVYGQLWAGTSTDYVANNSYTNKDFGYTAASGFNKVQLATPANNHAWSITDNQPYSSCSNSNPDGWYYFRSLNSSNGNISLESGICLDTIKPQAQAQINGSSVTNGSITAVPGASISVMGSDERSGIASYWYKRDSSSSYTQCYGTSTFTADGVYTFYVQDRAGNISDTATVTKDTVSPTITMLNGSTTLSNGAYTNASTVTFQANDSTSGVEGLYIKLPGANSYTKYSSTASLSTAGTYSVYAKDVAGNTSSTYAITVDRTAPSASIYNGTTLLASGSYTNASSVKFTTNDSTATCYYKTGSGSYATCANNTSFSAEAVYSFYAKDTAGNESSVVTITVDRTAPTATLYVDDKSYPTNNATVSASSVYLYATDTHGYTTYVKKPGAASFVSVTNGTKFTEEGTYTFCAQDPAGNKSAEKSITLDRTLPKVSVYDASGNPLSSSSFVKTNYITMTVADSTSIKSYVKVPGAGEYTAYTANTKLYGDGAYSFYAVDSASNSSAVFTVIIDNTSPVGMVYTNGTTAPDGSYIATSFSYSAVDSGSGIETYYYKTPVSGAYLQYSPGTIIPANSGDGWYYFYCVDKVGNVSETTSIYLETANPIVGIYRNGKPEYSQTVTNSGTYDTDLYYNIGDTFKVTCATSSGNITGNYAFDTDIVITDTAFSNDEFTITVISATGITSNFNVHIVRDKPQLVIDGRSYDSGSILYFNKNTTIKWSVDDNIKNHGSTGVAITSTGNTYVNEFIAHALSTDSYILTTSSGTVTTYTIKIADAAGNESSYTVVIDKEMPVGAIISDGEIINSGKHTNQPFHVDFTDPNATAQYSINGGEYKSYLPGQELTEDATYVILLTDTAGNKTSYTVTIDTQPPTGQLYSNYAPVQSGSVVSGVAYFTWDGNSTAMVNGDAYMKNIVISGDGNYTFVLTDLAGNTTSYSITIDTTPPSHNYSSIGSNGSYYISKWYTAEYGGKKYSFASYEEALAFLTKKAFDGEVVALQLNSLSDFTQYHLVADNGDPNNTDDEVRFGKYWLYKSKANPNTLLYYFDRNHLQEVIAYYMQESISTVNYYLQNGSNAYGEASDSMYDNLWISDDKTFAPIANDYMFMQIDSTEIYAELIGGNGQKVTVQYGVAFSEQFSVTGLYRITEIDEAGNEFSYYVYLDLSAPELSVNATIYGQSQAEMTISKGSLSSIAAYYYESFHINKIIDADKWSVLIVTYNGKTSYYTYGDALPVLSTGGEYRINVYDRLGNGYEFTVYIVGNSAAVTFANNADDTAFELKIKLEQKFDTIVSLEIYRNDNKLSGISSDQLTYALDKAGVYTVMIRDNFGRVVEYEYTFIKSLPSGNLSGVTNGGKTKSDVAFDYDNSKYYAEIHKNSVLISSDTIGKIIFSANDTSSGDYFIRLINLTDPDNYRDYNFTINNLAPAVTLSGVVSGGTTNSNVMVLWNSDDIVSATYTLNGEVAALTSGQALSSEGEYIVTIINDLGTETVLSFSIDKSIDYYLLIGGQQSALVDTTNKSIAVNNDEEMLVALTKNGKEIEYVFGAELTDEGIYNFRLRDIYGNAANFTITIDRSVSFAANVGNGVISNGGVQIDSNEKLTVMLYKDGIEVDYIFGDVLDAEGEYTAVLRDAYGNEESFTFMIVSGVKTKLDYTLGGNVNIISVLHNGEEITINDKHLNFTTDGEYIVTVKSGGEVFTFILHLDATPPTVTLNGALNGGVSGTVVKIENLSEPGTVEVYYNGQRIAYELGDVLSDYGDYHVVVTDEVGNKSEYTFTLKHILNGGAVMLIAILIIGTVAVVVAIILLKRGVFKKKSSHSAEDITATDETGTERAEETETDPNDFETEEYLDASSNTENDELEG